jgi:hypothetical protein
MFVVSLQKETLMEQASEATLVSNSFGTVTSKRVIYNRSKSWFGSGTREDIPLKHVTSVRVEVSRSILGGILFSLIGISLIAGGAGALAVCSGVGLLTLAALLLWGSPAVVVNTAGQDLRPAKGAPWERSEADSFVEALRQQIFKD